MICQPDSWSGAQIKTRGWNAGSEWGSQSESDHLAVPRLHRPPGSLSRLQVPSKPIPTLATCHLACLRAPLTSKVEEKQHVQIMDNPLTAQLRAPSPLWNRDTIQEWWEKIADENKWLQKPKWKGLEWLKMVASGPNCAFPVFSISFLATGISIKNTLEK